jgi:DNA-binding MarR family transcriptional regulator
VVKPYYKVRHHEHEEIVRQFGPLTFAVWCSLRKRASKFDGACWPYLRTIAADANVSIATVKRSLRSLEEGEFIRVETGKSDGTCNIYYVCGAAES